MAARRRALGRRKVLLRGHAAVDRRFQRLRLHLYACKFAIMCLQWLRPAGAPLARSPAMFAWPGSSSLALQRPVIRESDHAHHVINAGLAVRPMVALRRTRAAGGGRLATPLAPALQHCNTADCNIHLHVGSQAGSSEFHRSTKRVVQATTSWSAAGSGATHFCALASPFTQRANRGSALWWGLQSARGAAPPHCPLQAPSHCQLPALRPQQRRHRRPGWEGRCGQHGVPPAGLGYHHCRCQWHRLQMQLRC